MRKTLIPLALLAVPATAQEAPSPQRMRADVQKMVSFGTRHSASTTTDPKRGIGAARNWVEAEFKAIGKACGGCLRTERIARSFTGPRAPTGVEIADVLAIQPGTEPNRVVIIMGHLDSRNSDVMDAAGEAPGANDDASGVALAIESARLLSKSKHRATIVYAALSGEEQGLWGATLLAETAKQRGWIVDAVLNNDIVGNTVGQDGRRVADRVRVFSEGIRQVETIEEAKKRRGDGGEDDGPSRALAKAIDATAKAMPGALDVFAVRRPDRFGRGGDHEAFLRLGYPAVRFTVGVENYDQQHQNLRTENGRVYGDTIDKMNFDYAAKVTAINVAVARRLADAPSAPTGVSVDGALGVDSAVKWAAVPGTTGYRIHWRRNDAQDWTDHADVGADATSFTAKGVIVDDYFFGVSALAGGAESIVTFAGRAAPTR
ncbi:M28 family metallopeptidase [Sphingomonas yantingensis]|uniref:Acetylornithine deacetylase/succinyl-diaminopimelate desuccinylase-like protein n=1 Tax=Sphingomonas yantingensis TaxID=1241761 RepID=A0A7W9EGU9_9SPHN|nr:M28 family metallopeptidase [Sphingomonas yantingensis]MBB5697498.1 acetylornithine deacetylase/succinyl-diaminopimelate desuccinylase-like protein [Sphingomonas yantingensis]